MSMGCASTLVVRPAKVLTCLLIDIICRLVGVKKVLSVSAHPSVESKQFLISLKIDAFVLYYLVPDIPMRRAGEMMATNGGLQAEVKCC